MNRFITPGAAICCAISLAISGWALTARFKEAEVHRREQARAWHSVICYLEHLTVANPKASRAQVAEALHAYDHILELVDASPCQ